MASSEPAAEEEIRGLQRTGERWPRHRPLTALGAWLTAGRNVPLERTASAVRPDPREANWLSAHGGGMLCRGSTVRVGLTRWGGNQDRAWRVLQHLECHAAAQAGCKLAVA